MAVRIESGQIIGLGAFPVSVEIDLSPGLHRFAIVGLPDKAVEESRDRIASAIQNTGLRPAHKRNQRVTINLAPADLKKEGPFFDVPIALAYLLASKQVQFDSKNKFFIGELALDGAVRPIKGVLSLARIAEEHGIEECYVPKGNGREAAFVKGLRVFEFSSLASLLDHLEGRSLLEETEKETFTSSVPLTIHGFEDIKGQILAKRAAEIAAAGWHHLGLSGPPGTGKTLIARAIASILPPLTFDEAIEVTAIHSVSGTSQDDIRVHGLLRTRPVRSPHHTTSHAALVGGGSIPRPGEITLAHRGVLFLDELPEFDAAAIEALREPLEDRVITVSRVRQTITFPAKILLVAAMNLCPCGNRGLKKACLCSAQQLAKYSRRISGPIMDRIDLWADVPRIEYEELDKKTTSESSEQIRLRTTRAAEKQQERFQGTRLQSNSDIDVRTIAKYCIFSDDCKKLLQSAAKSLELSLRAYHRVMKISRTIADLDNSDEIKEGHLLEALQFRPRMLVENN